MIIDINVHNGLHLISLWQAGRPYKNFVILLRRLVLCDHHISDRQAMLQQASSAAAPENMEGPKLSLDRCP